jgi:hypothetical protein
MEMEVMEMERLGDGETRDGVTGSIRWMRSGMDRGKKWMEAGGWMRSEMKRKMDRPEKTNGDKLSLSPFHCMIPIATIQCQSNDIGWLVRQSLAESPS